MPADPNVTVSSNESRDLDSDQTDAGTKRRRYILYGTGDWTAQTVDAIRRDSGKVECVAIVSGDSAQVGQRIGDLPVVGTMAQLLTVVERYHARGLLIATPEAAAEVTQPLVADARKLGLHVKMVSALLSVLNEPVTVRDLVDPEDDHLFRRRTIRMSHDAVSGYLTQRRVLVTGAGGSIGSALARRVVSAGPSRLFLLDHDESLLHATQLSLAGKAQHSLSDLLLADIRDVPAIDRIFERTRPDVVFHAAALKHVPLLDEYPLEAYKTNVLGTLSVLQSCLQVGVKKFLNISTDKATNPDSAYGYSKAIAERLIAHFNEGADGNFYSVRLNNVLGSRGSVLPTFCEQIRRGGPLTLTDPHAARSFVTPAEAADLIMQAGARPATEKGALIADVGRLLLIRDLANALMRHFGRVIDVEYIGLRRGERLLEQPLVPEVIRSASFDNQFSAVSVAPLAPADLARKLGCSRADIVSSLRAMALAGLVPRKTITA